MIAGRVRWPKFQKVVLMLNWWHSSHQVVHSLWCLCRGLVLGFASAGVEACWASLVWTSESGTFPTAVGMKRLEEWPSDYSSHHLSFQILISSQRTCRNLMIRMCVWAGTPPLATSTRSSCRPSWLLRLAPGSQAFSLSQKLEVAYAFETSFVISLCFCLCMWGEWLPWKKLLRQQVRIKE